MYHIVFIHLSVDGDFGCFVFFFLLLWMMLLWVFIYKLLCEHIFSFLLSIYLGYPGVELLVISVCDFLKTAKLFSKYLIVAPFCISNSNVWGISFSTPSPSLFYCLSFLIIAVCVGVRWYLIILWIYISLMTNDVGHHWLFVYLLWRSSYLTPLFIFKIWIVFFFILEL